MAEPSNRRLLEQFLCLAYRVEHIGVPVQSDAWAAKQLTKARVSANPSSGSRLVRPTLAALAQHVTMAKATGASRALLDSAWRDRIAMLSSQVTKCLNTQADMSQVLCMEAVGEYLSWHLADQHGAIAAYDALCQGETDIEVVVSGISSKANPLPPLLTSGMLMGAKDYYTILGAIVGLELQRRAKDLKSQISIGAFYMMCKAAITENRLTLTVNGDLQPVDYAFAEGTGTPARSMTIAHNRKRSVIAPSDGTSDLASETLLDFYMLYGSSLKLLARSPYHRQHNLQMYFEKELTPAFCRDQAKLYLFAEGHPSALVTWAFLTDATEQSVHATGRALFEDEWSEGDRLFFNDWITPYGNTREIVSDMRTEVFPDRIASSLRRNMDGSVRRINRWQGVDV